MSLEKKDSGELNFKKQMSLQRNNFCDFFFGKIV